MHIDTDKVKKGHLYARLSGELTIYHANAMKQEMSALLARVDELEMDLTAVSEIDTAGLQVLMAVKNEALAKNKQLILTRHSQAVVDLLGISNLIGFFGDPILLYGKTDNKGEEQA